MSLNKITAERNQRTLMELVGQPGNDTCADCKTRNPRWASHNLGIFICVNCASIHRKMGTHISKVKSLTLDSWSKEQVEFMKSTGNAKSNAYYNPNETRHPPPTNMIDSERDSDLEKYIRSKYEYKSFVSRSSQVAALLGPSKSASSRTLAAAPLRPQTMPLSNSPSASSSSKLSTSPSLPSTNTVHTTSPISVVPRSESQPRSLSHSMAPPAPPVAQLPATLPTQFQPQATQRSATLPSQQQQQQQQQFASPVWNDLAQLQAPGTNSSLPLQFATSHMTQPASIPNTSATGGLSVPNQFSRLSVSPNNPFPSLQQQQQHAAMFAGTAPRNMSLNTGLNFNSGMNMGPSLSPVIPSTNPSMFQPQPTMGGLSTPSNASLFPQNTTPSPNPYAPQSLPSAGLGIQTSFTPTSFGQSGTPMYSAQPQGSPSPMFQPQPQALGQGQQTQMQMQGSPMFPSQSFGQSQFSAQPQMQMGNPFFQGSPQPQQQPQTQGMSMTPYGSPQPPFAGSPSPASFGQPMQQPQQQMFGQPNASAFGGAGWQQTGFPGQQQQPWGGM